MIFYDSSEPLIKIINVLSEQPLHNMYTSLSWTEARRSDFSDIWYKCNMFVGFEHWIEVL